MSGRHCDEGLPYLIAGTIEDEPRPAASRVHQLSVWIVGQHGAVVVASAAVLHFAASITRRDRTVVLAASTLSQSIIVVGHLLFSLSLRSVLHMRTPDLSMRSIRPCADRPLIGGHGYARLRVGILLTAFATSGTGPDPG